MAAQFLIAKLSTSKGRRACDALLATIRKAIKLNVISVPSFQDAPPPAMQQLVPA
jgi:predicted RNase H-like nuclease